MKNLYVWSYLSEISPNYHDGGAVMILTGGDYNDDWNDYRKRSKREWEYRELREDLPEPDRIIPVADGEADEIWVFEDAGCC